MGERGRGNSDQSGNINRYGIKLLEISGDAGWNVICEFFKGYKVL